MIPLPSMFKRFAYPSLIGVFLLSLAMGGARANPGMGGIWRNPLHRLPGLGWLSPTLPIADVEQHRRGTVYLEGQVVQHLPLVNRSLYQLTDDSGSIWVLSAEPPPDLGQRLSLRVTIHYESILMRGQDIGEYYAEEHQRTVQE